MFVIHLLSWLCLLAMIPVFLWILWIKHRSSFSCWIRLNHQPERWLLSTNIDASDRHANDGTSDFAESMRQTVEEARNLEWNASCAYYHTDPTSKKSTAGLISKVKPLDLTPSKPFQLTQLPATTVVRVSGQSRHDEISVQDEINQWLEVNQLSLQPGPVHLLAQSFQCREWKILNRAENTKAFKPSRIDRLAETIFEMRDIALYPIIFTAFSAAMLGTGSSWFFGIGIFTMILMSGACKFVFLHQREDITQESHLQNY